MAEMIANDGVSKEWLLVHSLCASFGGVEHDVDLDLVLITAFQSCSMEMLRMEAKRKTKKGHYLPLHLLCRHGNSMPVLRLLIAAYPSAVAEKTRDGWLPLHYAARYCRNWECIQFIYEAFPEAASVKTIKEPATPYQLLRINPIVMLDPTFVNVVCQRCPLFNPAPTREPLLRNPTTTVLRPPQATVEAVAIPIDPSQPPGGEATDSPVSTKAFRSNARTMIVHGQYPLHMLCRRIPSAPVEEIQEMLSAFPGAAGIKTTYGWYPLHILCRNSDDAVAIELVLQAYPNAAKALTPDGWLPLHQLCRYSHSLAAVRTVLEAHPEGAKMRTDKGTLPADLLSKYYPVVHGKEEVWAHTSYAHIMHVMPSSQPAVAAQANEVAEATPVQGVIHDGDVNFEEVLLMLAANER